MKYQSLFSFKAIAFNYSIFIFFIREWMKILTIRIFMAKFQGAAVLQSYYTRMVKIQLRGEDELKIYIFGQYYMVFNFFDFLNFFFRICNTLNINLKFLKNRLYLKFMDTFWWRSIYSLYSTVLVVIIYLCMNFLVAEH
jgi:hypothetical protein